MILVQYSTEWLDRNLPKAVELSRLAAEAGLVVTHLQPMRCGHGGGEPTCFMVQLWRQGTGGLWSEASHESEESVRRMIADYARMAAGGDPVDEDRADG